MAVTAAAGTYATGKVFTYHFSQGGTLLDFDPVKSREFFQQEFESGQRFVADLSEVEEEVKKKQKGFFGGLFANEKQLREEAERWELMHAHLELGAAIAELRKEIAVLRQEY